MTKKRRDLWLIDSKNQRVFSNQMARFLNQSNYGIVKERENGESGCRYINVELQKNDENDDALV